MCLGRGPWHDEVQQHEHATKKQTHIDDANAAASGALPPRKLVFFFFCIKHPTMILQHVISQRKRREEKHPGEFNQH